MKRRTSHESALDREPPTAENHTTVLLIAHELDAHPDYLLWHYLRAAIVKHGNISAAARALSMHRRTVQRIIGKNCPPPHPEL